MNYLKFRDMHDDVLFFALDSDDVKIPMVEVILSLLPRMTWGVKEAEVETYAVAFDDIPVVDASDIAAVVINEDGDLESWGL